jgi:hypothetical protein
METNKQTLSKNCVVVFWVSNPVARLVSTNDSESHTASIFKTEKFVTTAWSFFRLRVKETVACEAA